MKKFKGTPGPWKANISSPNNGIDIYSISVGSQLAIVDYNQNKENICKANAKLIASAPELLKALQELLEFCKVKGIDNFYTGSAEGIIAKALGEDVL